MQPVLQELTCKTCFAYLDDVIIFGNTSPEGDRGFRETCHREAKVKLKKCNFLIILEGVMTDPDPQKLTDTETAF